MYCTLLVQEYIPITQRWNSELVRSENLNIIRHDRCCGHINLKQTSGDILRPRACLAVRTSRTNDNLLLSNFLNYTGPFSNRGARSSFENARFAKFGCDLAAGFETGVAERGRSSTY
jgi:hypothetical protein